MPDGSDHEILTSAMPGSADAVEVRVTQEAVVLERGTLRLDIGLRPFSITVRRSGRRLLRNAGAWVAEGTVQDHFVQFTEGVIGLEDLAPHERASRGRPVPDANGGNGLLADGVELDLRYEGGRPGRLRVRLPEPELLTFELSSEGAPLRLALDWDRRSNEHFVGLGVRHCTEFDQRGRAVQLGADRRYTGPDCRRRCWRPAASRRVIALPYRGCSRAAATESSR
jgi:hypothetical protein